MKRLLILPLLLLSGCAGFQVPGLNLGALGVEPDIMCSTDGRAQLVQTGAANLAIVHPIKKADPLCAALKRPAVAASAPGA